MVGITLGTVPFNANVAASPYPAYPRVDWAGQLGAFSNAPANWNSAIPPNAKTGLGIPISDRLDWGFDVECAFGVCNRVNAFGIN